MSPTVEAAEEIVKLIIAGVRGILKNERYKIAGAAAAALAEIVDAADDEITEHVTPGTAPGRLAALVAAQKARHDKAASDFEDRWGEPLGEPTTEKKP